MDRTGGMGPSIGQSGYDRLLGAANAHCGDRHRYAMNVPVQLH